jgi:GMP synthase-like glutamine amidotransferase
MHKQEVKITTIDLYNNEPNEGMRCIRDIVKEVSENYQFEISYDVYETRYKNVIPTLDYDIYISSGGPGSPFEGLNTQWEKKYFNLLESIWNYNQRNSERKKYIFFICHSFQMMARFFNLGEVNKRFINSFGIMPFAKTDEGASDLLLRDLSDPFYAADIRHWQVVNPNYETFEQLGAKILSWEIPEEENKDNPAITAVRISNEIFGTQFHPEADPASMLYHFRQPERKEYVVKRYSEARYFEMISWLKDPEKIIKTRQTILPCFLKNAIEELTSVNVQ